MDDLTQASQNFMESIRNLMERIERLERCARLLLLPVQRYQHKLTYEAFDAWLNRATETDSRKAGLGASRWVKGYRAGEYSHQPENIEVMIPDKFLDIDGAGLMELLLTIASFEQRSPAQLLMEIDPDLMSAVDACATVVDE